MSLDNNVANAYRAKITSFDQTVTDAMLNDVLKDVCAATAINALLTIINNINSQQQQIDNIRLINDAVNNVVLLRDASVIPFVNAVHYVQLLDKSMQQTLTKHINNYVKQQFKAHKVDVSMLILKQLVLAEHAAVDEHTMLNFVNSSYHTSYKTMKAATKNKPTFFEHFAVNSDEAGDAVYKVI